MIALKPAIATIASAGIRRLEAEQPLCVRYKKRMCRGARQAYVGLVKKRFLLLTVQKSSQ